MTTRSWVIWIIVLVLVIGAGFGGYWYFFTRGKVSADVETGSAQVNTVLTVKQGWNFVSFPYNTPTTISDLKSKFGATLELTALFRWSGSTWTDVIEEGLVKPGTGYLAYFSTAGTADLGNTGEAGYKKVEVPVVAEQWQLVGKPILNAIQFRSSSSSATDYVPYTGLSVKMKDGTTKNMLEAIAEGYAATSLFLENTNPSYSYLKLYDLSGNLVPDFSAFWFMPKSADVESIAFDSQGEAVDTTITRDSLESGNDLTVPSIK